MPVDAHGYRPLLQDMANILRNVSSFSKSSSYVFNILKILPTTLFSGIEEDNLITSRNKAQETIYAYAFSYKFKN